jgi:hypothetical protein
MLGDERHNCLWLGPRYGRYGLWAYEPDTGTVRAMTGFRRQTATRMAWHGGALLVGGGSSPSSLGLFDPESEDRTGLLRYPRPALFTETCRRGWPAVLIGDELITTTRHPGARPVKTRAGSPRGPNGEGVLWLNTSTPDKAHELDAMPDGSSPTIVYLVTLSPTEALAAARDGSCWLLTRRELPEEKE